MAYSALQIADRTQPFRSRIRATPPRWTKALQAMAVETSAHGLSPRDIEALFADETGTSLLSRSAVSTLSERLWAK
jgi:transposase-like protein